MASISLSLFLCVCVPRAHVPEHGAYECVGSNTVVVVGHVC